MVMRIAGAAAWRVKMIAVVSSWSVQKVLLMYRSATDCNCSGDE